MLHVIQNTDEHMLQEIRNAMKEGMNISAAIEELSVKGVSVTHSIRIIRIVYGLSLAEAKKLVEDHPVWKDMADATRPYHDELMNHLQEVSKKELPNISSYRYIHKEVLHITTQTKQG